MYRTEVADNQRWLFLNKEGKAFSDTAYIDLENYIRTDPENEKKGEVLWRAKAMQCEGVGEGWVQTLQRTIAAKVSDADMADAPRRYPLNTPQTKEELYYRQLFEDYYPGMAHVVSPWEGGCRAGGASWESGMYTREGIADVNVLTHALQNSEEVRASLQ